MIFTKDVDYMITLYTNLADRPTRLEDVANDTGLSLHFLEQIARKMRLAGYIKSVRGPGGGYVKTGSVPTLGSLFKLKKIKKDCHWSNKIISKLSEVSINE